MSKFGMETSPTSGVTDNIFLASVSSDIKLALAPVMVWSRSVPSVTTIRRVWLKVTSESG